MDAGPLLARHHGKDQHHAEALAAWREIGERGERCSTSNLVLAEAFTLMGRRTGFRFAAARAQALYASDAFTILRAGEDEEMEALAFMEKFADQKVSFTDCVSFVLMNRNRLRRAFTFDVHFAYAGFQVWPRRL